MQCAIDGCKRLYAVDVNDEIKRIRSMKCMSMEKDYPKFMRYTSKIPSVKNGKPRSSEDISRDKGKVDKRIDKDIICPMNWMQENLEKIQMDSNKSAGLNILSFLIDKPKNIPSASQMKKIRKIVEELDSFSIYYLKKISNRDEDSDNEYLSLLISKYEEVYDAVSKMTISVPTMFRLIQTSFGYVGRVNTNAVYSNATKYVSRMLNVLYHANKERFRLCFNRNVV